MLAELANRWQTTRARGVAPDATDRRRPRSRKRAPKREPRETEELEVERAERRRSDAAAWGRSARTRRKRWLDLTGQLARMRRGSLSVDLSRLEREWIETGNPLCVFLADALVLEAAGIDDSTPAWVASQRARWGKDLRDTLHRARRDGEAVDVSAVLGLTPPQWRRGVVTEHLAWSRDSELAVAVAYVIRRDGVLPTAAARRLAGRFGESESTILRAYHYHRKAADAAVKRLLARTQ